MHCQNALLSWSAVSSLLCAAAQQYGEAPTECKTCHVTVDVSCDRYQDTTFAGDFVALL